MQNATNFADAKNPNRYSNHMKKLKKVMRKQLKAEIAVPCEPPANVVTIPNHRKSTVTIPDRRRGDRRQKPKTRMHFGTEAHTQPFDAAKLKPAYEGRYKVKYKGAPRYVFRYWNPWEEKWQFNRRKAAIECVQPGEGDVWRGLAEKRGA